jgi:hypothetical protein
MIHTRPLPPIQLTLPFFLSLDLLFSAPKIPFFFLLDPSSGSGLPYRPISSIDPADALRLGGPGANPTEGALNALGAAVVPPLSFRLGGLIAPDPILSEREYELEVRFAGVGMVLLLLGPGELLERDGEPGTEGGGEATR